MSIQWSDFDKFSDISDKFLPVKGEGDTVATQIVTAVNKLVYKWFNDGDVYDNTYYLDGWCDDLSSYANWLFYKAPYTQNILVGIRDIHSEEEYTKLLYDLCELTLNEEYLSEFVNSEKVGTIYECDGPFEFTEGDSIDWDDFEGLWDDFKDLDDDEEYEEEDEEDF